MGEQEKRKVRVACSLVNGLELRLFERSFDDGTSDAAAKHPVVVGSVTLNGASARDAGAGSPGSGAPGVTEVDADFLRKWIEANEGSDLLAAVWEVDENGRRVDRESPVAEE